MSNTAFLNGIRNKYLYKGQFLLIVLFTFFSWLSITKAYSNNNKSFLSINEILDAWESQYGDIQSFSLNYSEIETTKYNEGAETESTVRYSHVDRKQEGSKYHIRYSKAEDGFKNLNSIYEGAFNGTSSKIYTPNDKMGTISQGLNNNNLETKNNLEIFMLMKRQFSDDEKYPEGTPYLIQLLRSFYNGHVQILPQIEVVAGEPCHVIDAEREGFSHRIWFAHTKDMLPLRIETFRGEKLISKIEVSDIAKIEDDFGIFWYPSKIKRELSSGGEITTELNIHKFLPHETFSAEDFDFNFPLGTEILDKITNITYVQGGNEYGQLPKFDNTQIFASIEANLNKSESFDDPDNSLSIKNENTQSKVFNETDALHDEGIYKQKLSHRRKWRFVAYSSLGFIIFISLPISFLLRYYKRK